MADQMNTNELTTHTEMTSKDERMTMDVHENDYESECSSSTRSDEDVARSALEIEADAFTRFVERQRVEVMFELRNLRMGERPVTGQPNRQRIQAFLDDVQERQQQQQQPVVQAPSTTRAATPRAFTADIDALANRRCVSAALGSTAFRRDLENAIRRTIETRPTPPPTTTQPSIPQAPPMSRPLTPVNRQQTPAPTNPVIRQPEQQEVHEPLNVERQERELGSWQMITQLQREVIVLEISDLVHRQLVTTALESDFRTHLEQRLLNRMAQGAPPEQAGDQQEQVPVVPRPRIQPTPTATRTTINLLPAATTIDELSARFNTMQNMLQIMFSMQMDMQRTLRQEVSSAIANNQSTTTMSSHPVQAGHCTICLTEVADTVLYRCGHLCVCYMCGLNLRENASNNNGVKCPICRAPVVDIVRVYRSSRDGEKNN